MQKRKLSSSGSEKQLAKKSKPKSSRATESSSVKSNSSKNGPTRRKTNTTKQQTYNILYYMKCPTPCSDATVCGSRTLAVEGNETKLSEALEARSRVETNQSKQPITYDAYCPRCQMPAVSFDDSLFQHHVFLCMERVFDFQGPCPNGLSCDEQNSDHFKRYNHDLLAQKRSGQETNNLTSEVQISEGKIVKNYEISTSTDPVYLPREKMSRSANLSPLKKLTCEMENIHKTNQCFSTSLLKFQDVNSDSNNLDGISEYSAEEKIAVNKKDGKNISHDNVDCDDDDDDDDNNGNRITISNRDVSSRQDFDEESPALFSEQDDDDDNGVYKPKCQSLDNHFCDADDADDEVLAKLVNSDDIYSSIAPKIPFKNLIDNKCSQDVTPANKSIKVLEKNQSSSNKCENVNNSIEQCNIKASTSTSSKQADIGTYFGLKPLKKLVEQSSGQHKTTEDVMDSLNDVENEISCGGQRKCPFYKRIPGTPFVVDAFDFGAIRGVKAYFLSHFHYDHYKGLKARFSNTIYCSKITANLVRSRIKVDARFIKELPMNTPIPVDKVQVTLLEANHCPGAVLFLFELPTGENFLHTGDFRACPSMEKYTVLRSKHITSLFLDTTYCDPEYSFPSQDEMVEFAVRTALKAKKQNPRTLIVCGTYTIGKEKVFFAIAKALGCKVSVTRDKKKTLDCFEYDMVSSMVTTDWNAGGVHVLKMKDLQTTTLKMHLNKFKHCYDEILAFKPTGWEHNACVNDIRPSKSGAVTIYGIPYSEHSSYKELERFVKFIKPNKIIPTVNVRSVEQRTILNSWISNEKVKG